MSTQSIPQPFPIADPDVSARSDGRYETLGLLAPAHPAPDSALVVPKLSLNDISLSYGTKSGERLLAVDHINLQVRAGEFVCIVGPSGCGKSTLLHLIAGLHPQTSGQILVEGNPVQGPGTDRIMIFQEHGLLA
jgi:ABC-type multidrug transport system fused ATPase/permease subunit